MLDETFISQKEAYLFNIGEMYHSYLRLGAHIIEYHSIRGTHFAVWAPNVLSVQVVGEFNHWTPTKESFMTEMENSGIWTLFIPKILEGQIYKYRIQTKDGRTFLKSDPYAFASELRPATASIVYSPEGFNWQDQLWMEKRQKINLKEIPLLIYEVHLGSWRKTKDGGYYTWRTLAVELLDYILKMGYTHLELMPIMEHPYDGSWGYQVTGYYSCTSRFGTPDDFRYFVDQCHQAGIGVILDWVPGHFCRNSHGLGQFNGGALYESEDNAQWGTYNFNFAKTEVWSFLISNAIFWLEQFHVDGLRVDGVSSMLYLDFAKPPHAWKRNINGGRENLEAIAFMQRLNKVIFKNFPGVLMIAEESTDWPLVTYPTDVNGLGYNFKWNMGWMNDTLRYMSLDFPLRKDHHNLLTFSLTYAFSENFILPLSHDEVVHGKKSLLDKMPGDYWQKFAGLRCLYGYWITHPGKKLIFMGGELAQFIEWRDDRELDWFLLEYEAHRKHHQFVIALNTLYRKEKALWENEEDWSGFQWIDVNNCNQSILIYCRTSKLDTDILIVLINFQPISYEQFRIGVPMRGKYQEILNSDHVAFGGKGQINDIPLLTEKIPWHGQPYSLIMKVPPLAVIILKQRSNREKLEEKTECFQIKKALSKPICKN